MVLDSLLRTSIDNCWLVKTAAQFLVAAGISPNSLSFLSLSFAVLASLFFLLSANDASFNYFLLLAGVCICLNGLLDGLDGAVAREIGDGSKKGDFLDHVIDRYSDVVIIGGIIFGRYVNWEIGIIAITGVLLSSYMGTQAQAVGLKRMYEGLLGRIDRIVLIIGATFLTLLYPDPVSASWLLTFSFPFLGWAILIIALLANATALQRFIYTWRLL